MNLKCRHEFMQTLPLRESILGCVNCGYIKRIGSGIIQPYNTDQEGSARFMLWRTTMQHIGNTGPWPWSWKLDQDRKCRVGDWDGFKG